MRGRPYTIIGPIFVICCGIILGLGKFDFNYVIINPLNLIGVDEFNQSFFDKIDQIEIDIANGIEFNSVIGNLNIKSINASNFKISADANEIEKKIFELKNTKIDIFEYGDDYIIYNIDNIEEKTPDLNDVQTKKEIKELVKQKSKFEYNQKLLNKIRNQEFNENDFLKIGMDQIKKEKINSIRDNKKFEINAVKLMYSLPINSYTLINDDKNNIYLAKIVNFINESFDSANKNFNEYLTKEKSNNRNIMLQSYDKFLSNKYNIEINQKTVERVKNFYQ